MNQRITLMRLTFYILFFWMLTACQNTDKLEQNFATPPESARPFTWWDWLDGNVTREGITADLEAMKRVGLGGAYLFNAGMQMPLGGAYMFNAGMQMPQGNVRFMQPEWLDLIDHTLNETKRLGLQFGIHNCDGFSTAGGPWITPETSMKQLTWSVTEAEGPAEIDLPLEQPETKENFYRDIAVIAFPVPQGKTLTGKSTGAKLRGMTCTEELGKLLDGNSTTQAVFPVKENGNTFEYLFQSPQTVRTLIFYNVSPHIWEEDFIINMEVSSDGREFTSKSTFSVNFDFAKGGQITVACEESTGIVFRLTIKNNRPLSIGEIELSETARVHFGEAKAGLVRARGHGGERRLYNAFPGPDRNQKLQTPLVVASKNVKDISGNMGTSGHLKWTVPAGKWRIARIGYTSTGIYIHPATKEGNGLECDKLDARVANAHFDEYIGRLKQRSDMLGGTLTTMEVDSWECGIQNWTAGFENRFRQKVGYDLLPFMPALLEGWIVDSRDITERLLWDWRRFLAGQFAENFFGVAADYARKNGLIYVGESTGRQQFMYDMAYIRNSEVTMGEMWNNTEPGQGVRVDNKLASSMAHISGKKIVATEAYTSGGKHALWDNHPFTMKPLGDKAFCAGVNKFVFSSFAHQPYDVIGPGFTFGPWGLNFNRSNTWWEQSRSWLEYLTRCQFMLRQGQQVNDVLYFIGEDVPNRIGFRDELNPVLPAGYDFDGCDIQGLMEAQVKDSYIVMPGGAEYRVLLLPNLSTMRPSVLSKVKELADAGVVVLGTRPLQSPCLTDLGEGDERVRQLAGELWDGQKPNVFTSTSFEQLFQRINLPPDFIWKANTSNAEILYVHRRAEEADFYFVSNQKNRTEQVTASFRIKNRIPEWWDPATGKTRLLSEYELDGDHVHVPLQLDPNGSGFVVFRRKATNEQRKNTGKNWSDFSSLKEISGPWNVYFPKGLGAPDSVIFDTLIPFTEHPEQGIRYFSGTTTYKMTFNLDHSMFSLHNNSQYLDLGKVDVIAEVELNGKNLGVLWKPPFRVKVDDAITAGENHLVVRVTNLWRNRLIGDAALPDNDIQWNTIGKGGVLFPEVWPDWLLQGNPRPGGRVAFCMRKDPYSKNDELFSSGLLGPVTIQIKNE